MQKRILRSSFDYRTLPHDNGFTIVELLVTIVIIGILAAITMIAYTGVSQHAISASLQSDLANATNQIKTFQVDNGNYPTTISTDCNASPTTNTNLCLKISPGNSYSSYGVNNLVDPKSFSLTATNSGQNYYITQAGTPKSGICPVLYLDAGMSSSYPGTGVTWNDLSGYGNNGLTNGGVSFDSANGGSLVFDGSTGYVEVYNPSNGSLNFGTGSFTIEMWLKFSAYGPDYRYLIYKGAINGTFGWRFGVSTAGIPHMLIGDTSSYKEGDLGTTKVGLNAWHDLTIVYNRSSNAVGYIDGTKVGSVNISTSSGSVNNTYGVYIASGAVSGGWYNGKIGVIDIRNVALSDSDVANSFNALRGRYGV
jgi:prepilin-type N-terminal cleavage/methylation domain-containing protein